MVNNFDWPIASLLPASLEKYSKKNFCAPNSQARQEKLAKLIYCVQSSDLKNEVLNVENDIGKLSPSAPSPQFFEFTIAGNKVMANHFDWPIAPLLLAFLEK